MSTAKEKRGLRELKESARASKAGNRKRAAELHSKGDADLGIKGEYEEYGHKNVKNPESHKSKMEGC